MTHGTPFEPQPLEPPGVPVANGSGGRRSPRAVLHRIRRRLPLPPLRSPLGILVAVMLVAGFASAGTVGTVVAIHWTETPDFCGRCHTMDPELKSFAVSPHREVTCGECHVEPGVAGWVKSKITGTKQLFQILTNTYPIPILPPAHEELPKVEDTCLTCHDMGPRVADGGPVRLILKSKYALDESNTESKVALVIRPLGVGFGYKTKGVHWHIATPVEYRRVDEMAQEIPYVKVTWENGTSEEFIAVTAVRDTEDVAGDIARLEGTLHEKRMDCLDCHNRVGHEAPTLVGAVDAALDEGRISADLPFVKREAIERLGLSYATVAQGDAAIDGLRDFYAARYPLVLTERASEVDEAIGELKSIYRLIATPHMKVTAGTFPNNLGHQANAGCFRCHDGAHYKVVEGRLTNETIPSSCQTCHTFPQIGTQASAVLIGDRPQSHYDRLWTFDHKLEVATANPEGTSCGACHTRTYCENCHATQVVQVPHDEMLMNHATVVRDLGAGTCIVCHQAPYCAQCHADESVLPEHEPDQVVPIGPTGLLERPLGRRGESEP